MNKFNFPKPFQHSHPEVKNVNRVYEEQLTLGDKASDWVANTMGSWKFIIWQTVFFALWISLNVIAVSQHWDPYPFILMNLLLSTQAAYAAPIIMMSQNRQANKDRIDAHNDYLINQKAEDEIRAILNHLAAQDIALTEIHAMISDLQNQNHPGLP